MNNSSPSKKTQEKEETKLHTTINL
jgi:hypothetical protein